LGYCDSKTSVMDVGFDNHFNTGNPREMKYIIN
jgi:hypothetical protein